MWVIDTTTREQVIQAEQREVHRPGPSGARTDILYPFSLSPSLYYSHSHSLYYSPFATLYLFRSSCLFSSAGKEKHINIMGRTTDRKRKAMMSQAMSDGRKRILHELLDNKHIRVQEIVQVREVLVYKVKG